MENVWTRGNILLTLLRALRYSCLRPGGSMVPEEKKAKQVSVVITKPGGTGSPRRLISQRLAPKDTTALDKKANGLRRPDRRPPRMDLRQDSDSTSP